MGFFSFENFILFQKFLGIFLMSRFNKFRSSSIFLKSKIGR